MPPGHDLSAEHLVHAHTLLVIHLRALFRAMIVRGCVPDAFSKVIIIPLAKDKLGDVNAVEQRGSAAHLSCHRRRSSDVYAASAWRGLTKVSDRQRINSVIDRARRLGYRSPDLLTFDKVFDTSDDELFSTAVRQSNHILHALLPRPSTASQRYNLGQRAHSLQCLNT